MSETYARVLHGADPAAQRWVGTVGRVVSMSASDARLGLEALVLLEGRTGRREVFRASEVTEVQVCACGCWSEVNQMPANSSTRGWVKGQYFQFRHGHNTRRHPLPKRLPMADPNPRGICLCGCGGPVPLVQKTNLTMGDRKGWHRRYCNGHNLRLLPYHPPPSPLHSHCKWEHALVEENLYWSVVKGERRRRCKACHLRRSRERWQRLQATPGGEDVA